MPEKVHVSRILNFNKNWGWFLNSLRLKGQYSTSDRLKLGHSVGLVEYLLQASTPIRVQYKRVFIKQQKTDDTISLYRMSLPIKVETTILIKSSSFRINLLIKSVPGVYFGGKEKRKSSQ